MSSCQSEAVKEKEGTVSKRIAIQGYAFVEASMWRKVRPATAGYNIAFCTWAGAATAPLQVIQRYAL